MIPPNHTRYIVGCLLVIVLACIGCGTWLFIAGYQSGELLIGIASAGTGALGGMVATRPPAAHPEPVEVTTPENKPLPVTETPKDRSTETLP